MYRKINFTRAKMKRTPFLKCERSVKSSEPNSCDRKKGEVDGGEPVRHRQTAWGGVALWEQQWRLWVPGSPLSHPASGARTEGAGVGRRG